MQQKMQEEVALIRVEASAGRWHGDCQHGRP
jgi:hypothetical protein